MSITREEISHLASAAELSFSDAEIIELESYFAETLGYVDQLQAVDTANVEPTFRLYDLKNVWREDEIASFEADRNDLLSLAAATENHQIKVPKVL